MERTLKSINSPLYYASMAGLVKSVEILLSYDVHYWDFDRALQASSSSGHLSVVRVLVTKATNIHNIQYEKALLKFLLDQGADVDFQDVLADPNVNEGRIRSALHAASEKRHEEVVERLLNRGADPNAQKMLPGSSEIYTTALGEASSQGSIRVVRLLLDHGADPNANEGRIRPALHAASAKGREEVVEMLLNRGADPNAQIKLPSSSEIYTTAVEEASSRGFVRVVQLLLDRGAYPNDALNAASTNGHEEVVDMLLNRGADPNAQIKLPGSSEIYTTALEGASSRGFVRVVQLLLDNGADANAPLTKGGTSRALDAASANGHKDVVRTLLEHGARYGQNQKDKEIL